MQENFTGKCHDLKVTEVQQSDTLSLKGKSQTLGNVLAKPPSDTMSVKSQTLGNVSSEPIYMTSLRSKSVNNEVTTATAAKAQCPEVAEIANIFKSDDEAKPASIPEESVRAREETGSEFKPDSKPLASAILPASLNLQMKGTVQDQPKIQEFAREEKFVKVTKDKSKLEGSEADSSSKAWSKASCAHIHTCCDENCGFNSVPLTLFDKDGGAVGGEAHLNEQNESLITALNPAPPPEQPSNSNEMENPINRAKARKVSFFYYVPESERIRCDEE